MNRDRVEWWFLGLGRRGNGELLFNRYRASAEEDEKVLEMNSGDGCSILLMHFMYLNLHVP